jgi:hypothetical protein
MDDWQFDALARDVSRAMTRRGTLRLMTSGFIIALPGIVAREEVAAKCVSLGRKCDKKEDKCCGGAKCKGRCTCRRDKKACDGTCLSVAECCASRERACNGSCIPNETCCSGVERTCSDGSCVPSAGCCGNADCNGGICTSGACEPAPHQGICTAGDDFCTIGSLVNCGTVVGACFCLVRPNGLSFCAQNASGCQGCTSDADCEGRFGSGTVCVRGMGVCGCGTGGSACFSPCPTPA